MFHLFAWTAQGSGPITNGDIPPVVDDILQIQNSHFFIQSAKKLVFAYAGAASLTRARLNSGTIRQTNPTYIRPINASLLPPTKPNVAINPGYRLGLNGPEELILELSDNVGTTENIYACAGLEMNPPIPQTGDRYRIRVTSVSTATAAKWTTLATTFETALPVGNYAVVGAEVQSTSTVAFRLIFDNQIPRPGWLGQAALGSDMRLHEFQDDLGVWGVFSTVGLPRLQVLCNAGDTAFEAYYEIVRTNLSPLGFAMP